MRVLGIVGSLRRDSYNRTLLWAAAAQLRPTAELVEYDGLASLPAYGEDIDTPLAPAPLAALREAIADADALIISTPEYNGSVPGALKNALDWASRPWAGNCLHGKPVVMVDPELARKLEEAVAAVVARAARSLEPAPC